MDHLGDYFITIISMPFGPKKTTMRFVALVSGGKDSIYSIAEAIRNGHTLVCLANLFPPLHTVESDSYMYQTAGHDVVDALAECMGVPLLRRQLSGVALNQVCVTRPAGLVVGNNE
jgi:diphthamide synthase (EF-2-diphthine--ammonia ligase)